MVVSTLRRTTPLALAQATSLRRERPTRPAWSRPSPAGRDRAAPRPLIVRHVSLKDFRSYARLELGLEPGIVLAVGPNGAGKTNLLESLHVGTQGFSPRTRAEAQLIRFGADAARVTLEGARGASKLSLAVTMSRSEAKRATMNGARLPAAEQLRREVATLVFTPDRLSIVKGGPAARRAYFDRVVGRLQPARAPLAAEYGGAVAQRNAALRRANARLSSRETVTPWTERVATLGAELVAARQDTLAALAPGFAERAGELGLPAAALVYEGESPTLAALEARLERDLERGATGLGPHLDDVRLVSGDRDLRGFGSQGEQRLTVLSLLLAEAALIAERSGIPPLLLLDDVLSELDTSRRRALVAIIEGIGQTVITATQVSALPVEPAQLLEVTPGEVRAA
jgi:DNA replication and repair protein RecF